MVITAVMANSSIPVEILYITPEQQWRRQLNLPEGSTVEQALATSQVYDELPETQELAVGVYGEQVSMTRQLQPFDRIELYRKLVFDPMESRRRRALHRANAQAAKQGNKRSAAALMLANQQPPKSK